MIDFKLEAQNIYNMMVDIRREMHMNPEIDVHLDKTVKLVSTYLDKFGIKYKIFPNNGIIAEVGDNNGSGNIVGLRADMDALEVVDLKDVSYRSKTSGYMHACGHDAHTAILIGTAAVLKKYEKLLKGKVRFIFQPAEESNGGAKDMIDYGALEGVKGIIGLHVEETINTGTIGVKKGVVSAASNPFEIRINGKGSHGASPQDGIDSIYIASKIIENLQGVVSREISATDSAVITIGKINGGTAQNAICSTVTMQGILRTLGVELRAFCKERIKCIVETTARMYRGEATVEFVEGYPSFENDEGLYSWFIDNITGVSGVNFIDIDKPSMGVEDFAYYTYVVPGLYYKLGCRNEAKGIVYPAHGSYFDIDEECLVYGCMLQSIGAFKFLEDLN